MHWGKVLTYETCNINLVIVTVPERIEYAHLPPSRSSELLGIHLPHVAHANQPDNKAFHIGGNGRTCDSHDFDSVLMQI